VRLKRPANHTGRCQNEGMYGNAKLTDSTLAESLNAACIAMAHYFVWDDRDLTASDIEALPDHVFNLAVAANWIPKPPEVDDEWGALEDESWTYLGNYVVQRTFEEHFLALIAKTLENLEPVDQELLKLRRAEQRLRDMGLWEGPDECSDEFLKRNMKVNAGLPLEPTTSDPVLPPKPKPTAKELVERWQDKTGHSLDTLAEMADVGVATVSRIKKGTFSYTKHRDSLKSVASVLECDWQDLGRQR
jgi:hypothetical protein